MMGVEIGVGVGVGVATTLRSSLVVPTICRFPILDTVGEGVGVGAGEGVAVADAEAGITTAVALAPVNGVADIVAIRAVGEGELSGSGT